MDLIDEVMPSWDRHEIHRRRLDPALPGAWDAVCGVTGAELPLMRTLMAVRTLGRGRGNAGRPLLDGFRGMGFRQVAERAGEELVVVGIGRFWQPSGGLRKVEGPEHFRDFDEPGYAKVAFNLRLADGAVSTETRIAATDPAARRRFGLYWTLVRPGSGLIRREWLAAIAKRAEAGAPTAR